MVPLLLCVAAVAGFSSSPASAASSQDTTVSSNWSGYAVTGTSFSSVSGSWVQPAATCTRGSSGYSAFWIGLGGFDASSQALEQIGTSADCSASGRVSYYAWYELVPAASVTVSQLPLSAGDTISASVGVSGTTVTLQLQDVTTGASFSKTLSMATPDVPHAPARELRHDPLLGRVGDFRRALRNGLRSGLVGDGDPAPEHLRLRPPRRRPQPRRRVAERSIGGRLWLHRDVAAGRAADAHLAPSSHRRVA